MAYYGRHRVHVMFWTWAAGPFFCTSDIIQIRGSNSTQGNASCSFGLHPRPIALPDQQGRIRRIGRGYLDVLRPNDWVFVIVDPGDGQQPEALFSGFIDQIDSGETQTPAGGYMPSINVRCSGWEKAFRICSAISDPWVSRFINIATMFRLALRGTNAEAATEGSTSTDAERDTFSPRIGRAIANIIEVFLRADDSDAHREATASLRGDSRADLERARMERLMGLAAGSLEELAPDDPFYVPDPAADSPVQALLGQFELPRTNIPLWQLIRMRFELLDEYILATPDQMVQQFSQPLVSFIDQWSNPLFNCVIYDTRRVSADGLGHLAWAGRFDNVVTGGYAQEAMSGLIEAAGVANPEYGQIFEDLAPTMIFMRRPLFAEELLNLEGPVMSSEDFTSLQVGYSDADLYNMAYIEIATLAGPAFRMSTGLTGFDANRTAAMESVRRHGLRINNDRTNAWPDPRPPEERTGGPVVASYSREAAREWNERLQQAGLDATEILSGSGRIKKYIRGLYLGGKIVIAHRSHPGTFADGTNRVYYVDSYGWQYESERGTFQTEIALTRGYEVPAERARILGLEDRST